MKFDDADIVFIEPKTVVYNEQGREGKQLHEGTVAIFIKMDITIPLHKSNLSYVITANPPYCGYIFTRYMRLIR